MPHTIRSRARPPPPAGCERRALLVAAHPEIDATALLAEDPPPDPRERLDRTLRELIALTIETEAELRTMLRLSLEPGPKDDLLLRQGRAIGWIEEALAPLGAGSLGRSCAAWRWRSGRPAGSRPSSG